MRIQTSIVLLAGCTLLAACGGGGTARDSAAAGAAGSATTVRSATRAAAAPDSAFSSIEAFIAFVRQLRNDQTTEPLALPEGTPAPVSETAEPIA